MAFLISIFLKVNIWTSQICIFSQKRTTFRPEWSKERVACAPCLLLLHYRMRPSCPKCPLESLTPSTEWPLGRQVLQAAAPPPAKWALHQVPAPERNQWKNLWPSWAAFILFSTLARAQGRCSVRFFSTKTAARMSFALEELSALHSVNIQSCAEATQSHRHHKSNSYHWQGRSQAKSKQNPMPMACRCLCFHQKCQRLLEIQM